MLIHVLFNCWRQVAWWVEHLTIDSGGLPWFKSQSAFYNFSTPDTRIFIFSLYRRFHLFTLLVQSTHVETYTYRTNQAADWTHGQTRFPEEADLDLHESPPQAFVCGHSPSLPLWSELSGGSGHRLTRRHDSQRGSWHRRTSAAKTRKLTRGRASFCALGLRVWAQTVWWAQTSVNILAQWMGMKGQHRFCVQLLESQSGKISNRWSKEWSGLKILQYLLYCLKNIMSVEMLNEIFFGPVYSWIFFKSTNVQCYNTLMYSTCTGATVTIKW